MYKQNLDLERLPPHPGEILREDILPCLGLSQRRLAAHLGISTRLLSDLLHERRPVTFDLAQRLGLALGQGTRYWLGLQAQYDVFRADQIEAPAVRPLQWRKTATAFATTRIGPL